MPEGVSNAEGVVIADSDQLALVSTALELVLEPGFMNPFFASEATKQITSDLRSRMAEAPADPLMLSDAEAAVIATALHEFEKDAIFARYYSGPNSHTDLGTLTD